MEEVLAPGTEGTQEIINRWRPFNKGESSADHLYELYPALLRMPVTVRAEGRGEEYVVLVPASTGKEDLLQIVEDEMLVRNHKFAKSAELPRLYLLCNVLALFPSHCRILNMSIRRRLLPFKTWPTSIKSFGPGWGMQRGYDSTPSWSFPTRRPRVIP